MRELGLKGCRKGLFRVSTTYSNHDLPIAPNHLAQTAPPIGPNQKWMGDITYIQTKEAGFTSPRSWSPLRNSHCAVGILLTCEGR